MRNELAQEYLDALTLIGYALVLQQRGFSARISPGDAERLLPVKTLLRYDAACQWLQDHKFGVVASTRDDGGAHTIEVRKLLS